MYASTGKRRRVGFNGEAIEFTLLQRSEDVLASTGKQRLVSFNGEALKSIFVINSEVLFQALFEDHKYQVFNGEAINGEAIKSTLQQGSKEM